MPITVGPIVGGAAIHNFRSGRFMQTAGPLSSGATARWYWMTNPQAGGLPTRRRWLSQTFAPAASGPSTVDLAAVVAGVGSIVANLTVSRKLATAIAGVGTVTANLRATRSLAAAPAGSGAVTANLKVSRTLSTVISGLATVAATTLVKVRTLATTVVGTATVQAASSITRRLAATPTGVAVISSALRVTKALSAAIAGVGTIVPNLTKFNTPVPTITQAMKRRRRMLREWGATQWRERRPW